MDRKALALVILFLSSLVVLLLVNMGQRPALPAASPAPSIAAAPLPSFTAMIYVTVPPVITNATIEPTATPLPEEKANVRQTSSPATITPTPGPSPTFMGMPAWKPVSPWSPVPQASPLSYPTSLIQGNNTKKKT